MRRILLADADAFFVAVARAVDPDGAGRAPLLIVGGSRDSRGVVCSASYEVRKFGVRSAMAAARAKPDGVVIVEEGVEQTFLRSCTLAEIPMVGPKFQERLGRHGLITVEDVLRHDLATLQQWMSKREAAWLWHRVHGSDEA